jgi:hypothetical protein
VVISVDMIVVDDEEKGDEVISMMYMMSFLYT